MTKRTILLTGVSGALGSAVLEMLIPHQDNLVLIARKIDTTVQFLESVSYPKNQYIVLTGDVTSEDSLKDIFSKAIEKFHGIDTVIHTAGTYMGGKPVYLSDNQMWDTLFTLNAKSLFLLSKFAVPEMIKQQSGVIITIGSRGALEVSPGSGFYGASKSATIKLTQTLAKELIDKNIRVNCILPSTIDTDSNRKMMPNKNFNLWVKPSSIANLIEFLISDKATDITGAAIPIYGKEF